LFSATLSDSIKELKTAALSSDPFCWEQVQNSLLIKLQIIKPICKCLVSGDVPSTQNLTLGVPQNDDLRPLFEESF
jgi:hypothetical protein